MKITMAADRDPACVVIDSMKLTSRAEVERFIRSLRKVADAVWPPVKTKPS